MTTRMLMDRFDLNKPTDNSPLCYKNFYHLFYLTTLTDKLFISYMVTSAENTKLLVGDSSLTISDDIDDFLEQISENIQIKYHKDKHFLACAGLDYSVNVNSSFPADNIVKESFAQVGNANNSEQVIKNFLNTREFQMLYGFIETAIKGLIDDYKNKYKLSKQQETELSNSSNFLFKAETLGLVKLDKYTKSAWKFYIKIRNLYAHQYGFLTNESTINELFGKTYDDFMKNLAAEFALACNYEEIMNTVFNKQNFHLNKLYLLNDLETLIFRDIAIDIMESIDSEYINSHT